MNDGDYEWVLRSSKGFGDELFDVRRIKSNRYINGGFQILNDSHKDFFETMKTYYNENSSLISDTIKKLRTATDQTILNFMLDKHTEENGYTEYSLPFLVKNESLIGTILLGNNIVNILATSLATAYFVKLFGDKGIFLATFCMTVLILVFSELLPKTYAINNQETAARRVAPLVLFFIYIFSPVIIFVRKFVQDCI